MDEMDRQQEVDERLAAQRPRPTIDRQCLSCGRKIPAEILIEDPDALTYAGAEGCAGA